MSESGAKGSFILHRDTLSILNEMNNEQAGVLFKSIFHYQTTGELPDLDFGMKMALSPFIAQFKRDKNTSREGEFHWNWKGGITPHNRAIRSSSEYKEWRVSVFKRDNYTCLSCKEVGGKLHAHHIKSFSEYHNLRLSIDNGVTLCKKCHQKIHSKGK